jgi:hypothetical protein
MDEQRLAQIEKDIVDLKRACVNPVFGLLEWLGKESRKDVARIEASHGETRGKLLALEAMVRALSVTSSPALLAEFERRLLHADADLVALALSEPACRAAREALAGAAVSWRALLKGCGPAAEE